MSLTVVGWIGAGSRRPHWGYNDGWPCWLRSHWAVQMPNCSKFSSWSTVGFGDHCCEVTAVNIHRDAHISFQGAQVTDGQEPYLTV